MRELNGNRVEGQLLQTMLYSLISSFIVLGIFYFMFLGGLDLGNKLLFIFLSIVSYAIVLPAFQQVHSYKNMPCMSGMMVGMTVGMISSFLIGFYVASTNGMFYGWIFGMVVGLAFGIYNGSSCGIMGIMEGAMAAFMGGLMGAMTSLMLLNDHLIASAYIILGVGAVIMGSLNFMVYKDMKEIEEDVRKGQELVIILSVILTTLTILFIAFGPRGGIFA